MIRVFSLLWLLLSMPSGAPQDLDQVLEKADRLLETAKTGYESARDKSSAAAFVEAGFTLEEARIKYLVLQEIGPPDKQKIAADRLRAVNQLAKLIHDGKVAISGTPAAQPAAPKPEDPPPAADPAAPRRPAPQVLLKAREPVPEAARQKESEKLIRELFKDQYAKKTTGDRQGLARLLMEQAAKTSTDRPAQWVLYREAQDLFAQSGDGRAVFQAIEECAFIFDIDALALKAAAVGAMGKVAKSPDDYAASAALGLRFIDDLIANDDYVQAEKTAAQAVQHARRSGDAGLSARAAARAKESADARQKFAAMKKSLEVLARTPDDGPANLEMGRFLCFVKGNWDLGIRFLVKGSDAALKAVSEKELAAALDSDFLPIGDGWWELAEKDKGSVWKERLQERARFWYELALPKVEGLARTKLEKRLESLQPPADKTPVNLLKLIDPRKDAAQGEWTLEGGILWTPAARGNADRLTIPYVAPEEYDLSLVVERKQGDEGFHIGLTSGSSQVAIVLDANQKTGMDVVDGKSFRDNAAFSGKVFSNGRPSIILASVRQGGVTIVIDGKALIKWQGNRTSLGVADYFRFPNPKALYIGSSSTRYAISKIVLTPVTGAGKGLR